jgi:hypothetical protein
MAKKIREKVTIEIKSCDACSFLSVERVYTSDSWDNICKWICRKTKRKKNEICGYLDWMDDDPKIPKWCPLRVKNK